MKESERHVLDISVEEMKSLQEGDPSLEDIRKTVKVREAKSGVGFFRKSGLLYRRWLPKHGGDEMSVEQLILPQRCRSSVMSLAHSIPLAGHMGKNKTTSRILQRFYWPTVYQDVATFCQSCASCQLTRGRKVARAPLIPLPIITEPFSRIAVGPLSRSRRGNRTYQLYAITLRDIQKL